MIIASFIKGGQVKKVTIRLLKFHFSINSILRAIKKGKKTLMSNYYITKDIHL